MALPRKLKLMNLFIDGVSYLGVVQSVTLPKLTRKLENYRGGGMNGSAPVDLGLDDDALSAEISLGGFPMTLSGRYTLPPARPPYRYVLPGLTSVMTPARPCRLRLFSVAVRKKSTSVKPNRAKTPSRKSLSRVPISS